MNDHKIIKVKIIRHSERLDFSYPIYWLFCFGHYWSDSPLTKNGYNNAKNKGVDLVKDDFTPKYIYTSPYNRTMATATEIKKTFPKSEIIIEPLLSEHQPYFKHTINLYPDGIPTSYQGEDTEFSYPETYEQFSKRVKFIMFKLFEKSDNDILIVTHGELLKAYIIFLQNKFIDLTLDPGSLPYLTTLSFIYDKTTHEIIDQSIQIEKNKK